MAQITLELGSFSTGDTFNVVCRWIDKNGVAYAEEVEIANIDDMLVIRTDDREIISVIGNERNREKP